MQELKSNRADEKELKKRKRVSSPTSDEEQPAKKFKNEGDKGAATSGITAPEFKPTNSTEPEPCMTMHSARGSVKHKKLISEEIIDLDEKDCGTESSSLKESIDSSCKSENLKRTVLTGENHDFEVILNEDYSNGSTGSILVDYNISGIGKDLKDTCDSTVHDDHITVSDNEVAHSRSEETIEERLDKDFRNQSEDKSVKSSHVSSNEYGHSKSTENKLENASSSESLDKSPDSTTMELQEKHHRKEAFSPGNFKDVFKKLKDTVRSVKESLPLSPLSTGDNVPDSSSKVDVELTNAIDINHHLLQAHEEKEEDMNVDVDGNLERKTEQENKAGKSKRCHLLKLVKTHNDIQKNSDDLEEKDTNSQECIVISSPEYSEKSNASGMLGDEGFHNAGDSPLKIVRVASEAPLKNVPSNSSDRIKSDFSSKSSDGNESSADNFKTETLDISKFSNVQSPCVNVETKQNDFLSSEIEIELKSLPETPDINAEEGIEKQPDISDNEGMENEPDINTEGEMEQEPDINNEDEIYKADIEIDTAEIEMKSCEESADSDLDNGKAALKTSPKESTSVETGIKKKDTTVEEDETETNNSIAGPSVSSEEGAKRKKGSKRQIERLEKLLEVSRSKVQSKCLAHLNQRLN